MGSFDRTHEDVKLEIFPTLIYKFLLGTSSVEGKHFIKKMDTIRLMNLITTKEISFQSLKTLRIKLQN